MYQTEDHLEIIFASRRAFSYEMCNQISMSLNVPIYAYYEGVDPASLCGPVGSPLDCSADLVSLRS